MCCELSFILFQFENSTQLNWNIVSFNIQLRTHKNHLMPPLNFHSHKPSIHSIYSYIRKLFPPTVKHTRVSKTLKKSLQMKIYYTSKLDFNLCALSHLLRRIQRRIQEKKIKSSAPWKIKWGKWRGNFFSPLDSLRVRVRAEVPYTHIKRVEFTLAPSYSATRRVCKLKNNKNRLTLFNANNQTQQQNKTASRAARTLGE